MGIKISLVLISTFCLSVILHAQTTLVTGEVRSDDGEAIEYANLGILNEPVGTVSNEYGVFELSLPDSFLLNDKILRISCVGYKTVDLVANSLVLEKPLKINLEAVPIQLEEIVITSQRKKLEWKGKRKVKTTRNVNFTLSTRTNQNLGAEIGKKIKFSKRERCQLKSVKFYIGNNNFEYAKLRLNIYRIQSKLPKERLHQKNILISLQAQQKGWIEVDLLDENLVVNEDIIVSIEWIGHSEKGNKLSLPIIVPSFGSTHYYKYGSQSKWKKFSQMSIPLQVSYYVL